MKSKLIEEVSKKLRTGKKNMVNARRFVPSAILMPIYEKEGELYILFTKRSNKLKEHKGQISFPGGKYDGRDLNLLSTALREFEEEMGVSRKRISILGELDNVLTVTGYVISPYVASIPYPIKFKVSENEVESIFSVPISFFLEKNDNYKQKVVTVNGKKFVIPYYLYHEHLIWGATARILLQFLKKVYDFVPPSEKG